MSAYEKQEILLESGTNEVEIIEFYLGSQSFGINVHKLREIVPYDPEGVTVVPESEPSMIGVLLLRGHTVPLIDLGQQLRKRKEEPKARQVVLVCEFNREVNSFLVDGVNQIHRLSWKDVRPMDEFFDPYQPRFTGCVHIEDRQIMIVDLEHVISEIFPEQADCTADEGFRAGSRQDVRLLLAEDSSLIRNQMMSVLKGAGYENVTSFINGEECYQAMRKLKAQAEQENKDIRAYVNLVVTDIEMPSMDGLTLCRKIKEELGLKDLPVFIFSSLINDQIAQKCKEVGADQHLNKPQIRELVQMVDEAVLQEAE